MKVTLEKNYREYYTLEDLDIAKQIIKEEKEDEFTAKEWAKMAVGEALKDSSDFLIEVLSATATTGGNADAWDRYFDGSRHMDVWIEATAKTCDGYIEIGAYLSDIWQTGAEPYKHNMYIQKYERV